MIPYESYKLNSKQIERIARAKARERIQKYVRDYGHAPSQELISTFGTITANELERYRQIYYSRNSEKENVGITATVEGWATQTQKVYDEFIRLVYNVRDTNNLTQLFNRSTAIGYIEIDGVEKDFTNGANSILFDTIGVHTVNILLKNVGGMEIDFKGVTTLKEIVIPSCFNQLNSQNVFYGCSGLESITCKAITPPALYGAYAAAFKGVGRNGVLYVPQESIERYENSAWLNPPTSELQYADYRLNYYDWIVKPIQE